MAQRDRQTWASGLSVCDDSDGAEQLVDGVDKVLVGGGNTLDARLADCRHRQVVQIGVELHIMTYDTTYTSSVIIQHGTDTGSAD